MANVLEKDPTFLVHCNSGIVYVTENWEAFCKRFQSLQEAVDPVLKQLDMPGFRRMLLESSANKARLGYIKSMLFATPQSRTTIGRPFSPDNVWTEENLARVSAADKLDEVYPHWRQVTLKELVMVRMLLNVLAEQQNDARDVPASAVNAPALLRVADPPEHICRGYRNEPLRIGGLGDAHYLSFWIDPLQGVAPAALPYMSDAFIIDWIKNPFADEPVYRNEMPMRVWHHQGLGPLLGVTAPNLLNEVWRTVLKWLETNRYVSTGPALIRKLHKERYPESSK